MVSIGSIDSCWPSDLAVMAIFRCILIFRAQVNSSQGHQKSRSIKQFKNQVAKLTNRSRLVLVRRKVLRNVNLVMNS